MFYGARAYVERSWAQRLKRVPCNQDSPKSMQGGKNSRLIDFHIAAPTAIKLEPVTDRLFAFCSSGGNMSIKRKNAAQERPGRHMQLYGKSTIFP